MTFKLQLRALFHLVFISVTFFDLSLAASSSSLPQCSDIQIQSSIRGSEYDFVVVGSGAGGGPLAARLAETGFSGWLFTSRTKARPLKIFWTVLVVEVGHDVHNLNTTIPLYFIRALEDPEIQLNYTVDEYPEGFRFQKNDAWYPRARGLGGCTTHNALLNIIAGTRSDFSSLSETFNDSSWSRANMHEYYKKITKSYNVASALLGVLKRFVGIGNSRDYGWLKTSLNPVLTAFNPKFFDLQTISFFAGVSLSAPPILSLNTISSDGASGMALPSLTVDKHHTRSSVRNRLIDIHQTLSSDQASGSSGKLTFLFDTLATKILLCQSNGIPTAYGIEFVPGGALPVASNFGGSKEDFSGRTRSVVVRKEVIISAGVFQSPQLLMLSGIGNSSHLQEHGIQPVVHLPGVGNNLQDHDEIAIMWRTKSNFSFFNGCKFLSDLKDDPCLEYWIGSGGKNVYSFSALNMITSRSPREGLDNREEAPDILTYFGPLYFPGFVRGVSQGLVDNSHNTITAVVLKAHPSSSGTVRLTGSHPQDLLQIKKNRFQEDEKGYQDVVDLREGIKKARKIIRDSVLIGPYIEKEVFPGEEVRSDEEIEEHVYKNIFGHHACCTNAMGPESDENAVLDGNFKVHGVNNLRVVDASSWPKVPGFFVTTPTYMISEKAADLIISDERSDGELGNGMFTENDEECVDECDWKVNKVMNEL
ncbi:hypothetical protein VKT23_006303 [Stygiomarasmius scandens]|uniref:Glucose-methanol-choline oxidoreductase N-terminal domain-containing protein n=1 Tax=Marasmiellus scandens TaxID=2682957 RepID=A0ABR1JN83_9AGAR